MTQSAYFALGGGLDLVTPVRQLQPGNAIAAVNYECPITGGYRRIDGYTQLGPEVPGEGPMLGVATFHDRHYAIRRDGAEATLYRLNDAQDAWLTVAEGLHPGRHEFDEGNLYATEGGTALYGVGGGKPFELAQDETVTVLEDAQAGATMIALHRTHLILGFDAGSLQFSGIGDPANWDAATGGAGEIGVGQTLTGLVKGVGGVLHILCRDSIQTWRGSSLADGELQVTVPGAGARRYSGQSMMMPFFVGERGITNLQSSNEFGDFTALQPGRVVEPLFTRARLADRVVASAVSKAKGQYRVFFDDRSALYVSPTGITRVEFPDQITVTHTAEFSSGEEVLLVGDDQGRVHRLDSGDSFNGEPIRAFLTLAFNDLQAAGTRKRFRRAIFDIRSGSSARVWVQPDFGYGDPDTARARRTAMDYVLSGGLWNADRWNEFRWTVTLLGEENVDCPGTANSINFAIFSEDIAEPHELLGYELQYEVRRLRRG